MWSVTALIYGICQARNKGLILLSGLSIKQPERNPTKPKYSLRVNSDENNNNNIRRQHIGTGLYYKYVWRFQTLPSVLVNVI